MSEEVIAAEPLTGPGQLQSSQSSQNLYATIIDVAFDVGYFVVGIALVIASIATMRARSRA